MKSYNVLSFCKYFILLFCLNFAHAQGNFENVTTFNKHTSEITALSFSPNGHYLLSGDMKGDIFIWNVENLQFQQKLSGHTKKITSICFSTNGLQLATASYDGTVKLWDFATKANTQNFQNPSIEAYGSVKGNEPTFVCFGANDTFLYFGGYHLNVLQVNLQSQEQKIIYTDPSNGITCGGLTADKKYIAFASKNKVQYFNPLTQTLEKEYTVNFTNSIKDYICEMACSADKKYVALWTYGGDVVFLYAHSLLYSHRIKATTKEGSSGLAFSGDGKILLSANVENKAVLWSVTEKKQMQELIGHGDVCESVAFSTDTKYIATGSQDKTVKIWQIKPISNTVPNQNDSNNSNNTLDNIQTSVPLQNQNITIGQNILLKNLQFEQSKATLLSSSYEELNNLALLMQKKPTLKICLQGHTDNVGDSNKNYELSDKRVKAVKAYLINVKGIAANRITTEAFGDSQPIADNSYEETRKLNRRVTFKVTSI
jgi:outer membrane protein OmpA-like peptidoglycan-associated protein